MQSNWIKISTEKIFLKWWYFPGLKNTLETGCILFDSILHLVIERKIQTELVSVKFPYFISAVKWSSYSCDLNLLNYSFELQSILEARTCPKPHNKFEISEAFVDSKMEAYRSVRAVANCWKYETFAFLHQSKRKTFWGKVFFFIFLNNTVNKKVFVCVKVFVFSLTEPK